MQDIEGAANASNKSAQHLLQQIKILEDCGNLLNMAFDEIESQVLGANTKPKKEEPKEKQPPWKRKRPHNKKAA